jgi:hypothetical protein
MHVAEGRPGDDLVPEAPECRTMALVPATERGRQAPAQSREHGHAVPAGLRCEEPVELPGASTSPPPFRNAQIPSDRRNPRGGRNASRKDGGVKLGLKAFPFPDVWR